MEFTCMACGRKHIRQERLVDEHIHCECGFDFYAFYNQGLSLTIPTDEIRNQPVARAFRRLIFSTGRCRDAEAEAADYGDYMGSTDYTGDTDCVDYTKYTALLQKADPLGLMEAGLERYQEETLGKLLLNCGDVVSICESLNKNRDVAVKNKGSYVDIIEMQRKVKKRQTIRLARPPVPFLTEDDRLKGWQKEVMEEDGKRNGYLFGDAG